jgi:D-alanyl-D-alanine carboxypeptidase
MQALHLTSKFRVRLTPAFFARATVVLSLIAVLASPGDAVAAQRAARRPSVRQPTDDTKHRPRRHARRETRAAAAIHFERPESALELVSDLHQLMAARVRNGTWGVVVLSLTRDETLYSVNADEPLQPASNM